MNGCRQIGPRSSLFSHSFPSFYACYLLKSVQTQKSKSIYIGSTPNPPRRIRQHNGEIAQGARKTRSKRPWAMQMIIYGFPSRLAALQFEWAWQNPNKSRHLRGPATAKTGSKAPVAREPRYIKANVRMVRLMVCSHPYNTWPLHIKFFTEEAAKVWSEADAASDAVPLPPGFTYHIELEGVDGKSGQKGTGRKGPIDVSDEIFTEEHLAKNKTLSSSERQLSCSVCNELVTNYSSDPVSAALCPNSHCISVSHLSCLARAFSSQSNSQTLIPRGGTCQSCHNYVLWGDIVRGAFRRKAGGVICDPDNDGVSDDEGGLYESDAELDKVITSTLEPPQAKTRRSRSPSVINKKTTGARSKSPTPSRNADDLDSAESSGSDVELAAPRKRGRPRKTPATTMSNNPVAHATSPTRKRGRPRKNPEPVIEATVPRRRGRPPKIPPAASEPLLVPISKTKNTRSRRLYSTHQRPGSYSSSGEYFDFAGLSDGSDDELSNVEAKQTVDAESLTNRHLTHVVDNLAALSLSI